MFELPELPFAYNSLEPFIDGETMHVHHDGHHATYVKNLNDVLTGHEEFLNMDIEKLLKSLDKVPQDLHTKVKNNAGGHFHHSIFWTMLGKGKDKPTGQLLEEINNTFENFESFKEKFSSSALGVFGSGWTWLVWNEGKLEIINTPNQDSPISVGKIPVLTIDVWEHAYYLKYKNKRVDYIEAFWNVINWEEIEKRFDQTSS